MKGCFGNFGLVFFLKKINLFFALITQALSRNGGLDFFNWQLYPCINIPWATWQHIFKVTSFFAGIGPLLLFVP